MQKNWIKGLGLGVCLALGFGGQIAYGKGDPLQGQTKSAPCVTCHSTDGNSVVGQWPKLAGQHAGYMVKQLIEFKKGQQGLRWNPQMDPFVANMTEQDMEDLAAYYAEQTMSTGEASSALVELGRKIYHGGIAQQGVPACAACHGPSGLGNDLANWPRLAGQHADYTKTQLLNYQNGTRRNGPGMMNGIAKRMTAPQIEAVSSYINGMRNEEEKHHETHN